MRKISLTLLAAILFTPAISWSATSGGVIEALQMPAWIEYANGIKEPIRPGMKLNSGDVVKTGLNSRLLIRLDEGSLVKLGENAHLNFDSLLPAATPASDAPKTVDQDVFTAALNVIRGAFRFTTTKLGKSKRRNINVKIGVVTAGVRGTDIWGSAKSDKDILCLIEGKITAQRDGEPKFAMEDPLSFYIVPKGEVALPVQPVPGAKLAKWAAETELLTGGGVLSIDGQWSVNLMSLSNNSSIQPVRDRLAKAGYATEIQEIDMNGNNWYRIKVVGFKSKEDARTFADTIDGAYGITRPWIVKF
jgi:hypothetical protein